MKKNSKLYNIVWMTVIVIGSGVAVVVWMFAASANGM